MNLHQRIKEVGNHIDRLQETANKHKANGKIHLFERVCETMEENKTIIQRLYADLDNSRKITMFNNIRNAKAY